MKILPFIALLLTIATANAQIPKGEKPDYKTIKKEISDKKSANYYPELLRRMRANDTTLTQANYRHLYYGQVFQKDYDPYRVTPKMDELKPFWEMEAIEGTDRENAIKIANASLAEYPFDFRVLDFLIYLHHENGNVEMVKKLGYHYNMLLDTILLSGDGLTCETGFHVTSVTHEYALLSALRMQTKSQSLRDNCDYLAFEEGMYKVDGLYFDVSKLFEMSKF